MQVIETLVEQPWKQYFIRVWFEHGMGNGRTLSTALERIEHDAVTTLDLAKILAELRGVNAVQVKENNQSTVIYNDWP